MTAEPAAARARWVRALTWALIAGLAGFIAFCAYWRIDGGRWERVETPSMGTVAPVGTLLWIKPVDFASLRPGDFVTFHPPGEPGTTYSHRVYKIDGDGTIMTKGVIPAPDPWRLSAADVVGQVRMRWWGVGWLVAAAPVLIVGAFVVAGARALVRASWKLPVTLVLASLAVTIAISWYRPFVNAQQVQFAADRSGGANATYVGTGLLPMRLQAYGGSHVDLSAGQVGTVHVTQVDSTKKLRVTLTPAVPLWFWIALVAVCFVPATCSLVVGSTPARRAPAAT